MSLEAIPCDLDSFARKKLPSELHRYDVVPSLALHVSDSSLGPSPTQVFERLMARIRHAIVPALAAETRNEYFETLGRGLGEFVRVAQAADTVLESYDPLGSAEKYAPSEVRSVYRLAGERTAGEAGADEVEFAIRTNQSAQRLWEKLSAMPADENPEVEALKHTYAMHSVLLQMALIALVEASGGAKSSPLGIEMTLEVVRGSALRAFAAVREALALKMPPAEIPEGEAPFDEEDARLASF